MNHPPHPGALQPGQIIVGKYRVERVLGVGGMGAVVAATHLQLEEKVAIKVLHPEMLAHADVVTRFIREGRSAIKIRSEHAVKIHDVGTLENGAPYLVMEHLDGLDFSQALEREGRFSPAIAVDHVLQACEAIAEAHSLGIVHRDLKPANLFLTRRPDGSTSVKVLDFGISKATAGTQDAGMTKTQAVIGSPRYMSPEQMRSSRNVDARSDIWALGCILYEITAGALPFNGETMTELCAQILQDSVIPLRQRRPDMPPGLDLAILRCLEKSPDARYANLGELALALAPYGTAASQASAERIVRVLGAKGIAVRPSMPSHAGDRATNPSSPGIGQLGGPMGGQTGGAALSGSGAGVWGTATQAPPAKKSKAPLFIALGVVAVGAVVGGMFFAKAMGAGAGAKTDGTTLAATGASTAPTGTTVATPVEPAPSATQAATAPATAAPSETAPVASATATPEASAPASASAAPAVSAKVAAKDPRPVAGQPAVGVKTNPVVTGKSNPPAGNGNPFDGRH